MKQDICGEHWICPISSETILTTYQGLREEKKARLCGICCVCYFMMHLFGKECSELCLDVFWETIRFWLRFGAWLRLSLTLFPFQICVEIGLPLFFLNFVLCLFVVFVIFLFFRFVVEDVLTSPICISNLC